MHSHSCRRCKGVTPRTNEFFRKDRAQPDGLSLTCKRCWGRPWRDVQKPKPKGYGDGAGNFSALSEMRAEAIVRSMRTWSNDHGCQLSTTFTPLFIWNWILSQRDCECCSKPFDYKKTSNGLNQRENIPTVDRLDSTKGYFKENMSLLCWHCNRLKSNGDLSDFINLTDFMKRKLGW